MLKHRKRRLYFIGILVGSIGTAAGLVGFALRQSIDLYMTPQQVVQHSFKEDQTFRLGGMVVNGSVKHAEGLKVSFVLTDYHAQTAVEYEGILPALFREGQGIVAQGRLNSHGIFVADQVLAKHDANYKPPAISSDKQSGALAEESSTFKPS